MSNFVEDLRKFLEVDNLPQKKVESHGDDSTKITDTEHEILDLIINEYLTPHQIAIKRGTTTQAVYKVMARLRKRGLLKRGYKRGVAKIGSTTHLQPPKTLKKFKKYIRLHGQEFNIQLISKTGFYDQVRSKGNMLTLDDHTVRLYKDSIEIYSGRDFSAEDEIRATALSMQYWTRFFVKMEHWLKVLILKPRKHNINLVNAHYSEVDNELAREYEKQGRKFSVYTQDDGRLWFKIDNSFNLHEAETLHPDTSKTDMAKVRAVFNDIRDHDHIPLSELSKYMADTTKQINEISHGLKSVVSVLQALLPPREEEIKPGSKPDYLG